MRNYIQISLFCVAILLFFNSCYKGNDYSEIPEIGLVDVKKINKGQDLDSFIFVVSYLDGDGDLGLSEEAILHPPYNTKPYISNFYLEYYEKIDGQFQKVKPRLSNQDTLGYDWRFPPLNSSDKARPIKGDITVGVEWFTPPVYSNIIKFKIYIYDRKLHKSNVIETPEIRR